MLTDALRVPERRSRYWVDVARAYEQWNKPVKCYQALTIAERLASEEVRSRPVVRSLARRMLTAPTTTGMTGLRTSPPVSALRLAHKLSGHLRPDVRQDQILA